MLSAVPLLLAAEGSPLIRHGEYSTIWSNRPQLSYCGPRDAVLGVTVEVSGATYWMAIHDIAHRSARDSGASSAVGGGRLSARACVGHRATSLDGPGGPCAASARTTPHQCRLTHIRALRPIARAL